jgi:hypothetical protein
MSREPGDESTTDPKGPKDWTNSYEPVQVDVGSLFDYYTNMATVMAQAAGPIGSVLPPMAEMTREGLLTSKDPTAGAFAEGVVVANLMRQYQSDFKNFLTDVLQGVKCISSAAAVIGEIYRNGDGESAATINDIGFVFADPSARKPAGFPAHAKTTTYLEAAANSPAESGGQYCMAATMDDKYAIKHYPGNGGMVLEFADGSTKTEIGVSGYGYQASGSQQVSVIRYGGKIVSSTSDASESVPGGTTIKNRTQSPTGDSNAPGAVQTSIQTHSDGSQTITTTTIDAEGKAHTAAPVTIQPTQHDTNDTAGPVQKAEDEYGTSGSTRVTKDAGQSY